MTAAHFTPRARRMPPGRQRQSGGVPARTLIGLAGLILGAAGFVVFALWPRWPEPPMTLDAPALPITIAGVAFNVPPAAIRVRVQRRAGAQERIDLVFLWPSLAPPDPAPQAAIPPAAVPAAAAGALDRLFVTIAATGDTLAPAERVANIYPRHVAAEPVAGPNGLAVLAFRDGTPYQGEDLVYDAADPAAFLVRCSRNGAGFTPGICLYDRRIGAADIVVRFPRDWLEDWRAVNDAIERLLQSLRSPGG